MSHHHHGHGPPPRVAPVVQRRLVLALVPFVIATIVGLAILWPSGDPDVTPLAGAAVTQYRAEVVETDPGGCPAPPNAESFVCSVVTARLAEGPDDGDRYSFDYATGPEGEPPQTGDAILVAKATQPGEETPPYYFLDYERKFPLGVLAILFAVVVVLLSRWHGLFSLIGVGLSLLVLIVFVMPAILEGSSPLAVAIVGAAAIMFVNLYLAHGFNARTTTAILGTMLSLAVTGILAVVFVELGRFTGFGSEEASFLQLSADQINLEGLLLGGIVIGTLGVLDDVTITQASAVWELHGANRELGFGGLYRSALRIGRDHIASTVNTLVLAYAGASLPLLILFSVSGRRLTDVLNTEIVAEEVVRTLVGSIGLVASVPITTALAATVVASRSHDAPTKRRRDKSRPTKKSRRELEWRGDEALDDEEFYRALDDSDPPDQKP